MRRLALTALVLFPSSALLVAQSAAPPAFEVASVKPSPTQSRGGPRRLNEITLSVVALQPGGRVESHGRIGIARWSSADAEEPGASRFAERHTVPRCRGVTTQQGRAILRYGSPTMIDEMYDG